MARVLGDTAGTIGETKHSMLTLAEFQALYGPGWILADGSTVTGSRYAAVKGVTTVPDMRGLVLRGKNNGRSDGNQNPDGDSALGTFQSDAYKSHNHGGNTGSHNHSASDAGHNHPQSYLTSGGNAGNCYNPVTGNSVSQAGAFGTGQGFASISIGGSTATISSDGSNESRMKNGTVNIFIRIN